MSADPLKAWLESKRALVETALDRALPSDSGPLKGLVEAMRYSLLAEGKRLRPLLCLAGAEAVGGDPADALPAAVGIEMIHASSLIHDDLPAMDDDDMRRGRPSCHKAFGEARAILAGDGLLILAFETIAEGALDRSIDPERALEAVRRIGRAVGYLGMVGGQAVDMDAQGKAVDGDLVTFLHERKTAALIAASVASGAILGGGGPDRVDALEEYGRHIGLAFQIMDDVLDIEGDPATLGKPVGTDQAHQKATYPAAFGLGAAKQKALDLLTEAQDILKNFGPEADPLRWIAEYLRDRKK